MPIKAIALLMMNTGGRQMNDPPHGHKQRQQQPIEALPIGNQARFQVPPTALGILEGRLHPHTPAILLHTPPTGRLVGDEKPGFPLLVIPHRTRAWSPASALARAARVRTSAAR